MSGEYAGSHFNLVIERRVVQNMHGGMHSSGFGIVRAIDQCTDSGMDDGAGAHGAWFYGHEQVAVSQAMIAKGGPGFAQGDDFSMRRWVRVGQIAIESASDDLAFMHHDSADRNFSDVERAPDSRRFLVGWDLENAEAKLRDAITVVECDFRYVAHASSGTRSSCSQPCDLSPAPRPQIVPYHRRS